MVRPYNIKSLWKVEGKPGTGFPLRVIEQLGILI